MTRFMFVVALVIAFAATAAAQVTSPIRHTWIVTSCKGWNCAAAALVMADGSESTPHSGLDQTRCLM